MSKQQKGKRVVTFQVKASDGYIVPGLYAVVWASQDVHPRMRHRQLALVKTRSGGPTEVEVPADVHSVDVSVASKGLMKIYPGTYKNVVTKALDQERAAPVTFEWLTKEEYKERTKEREDVPAKPSVTVDLEVKQLVPKVDESLLALALGAGVIALIVLVFRRRTS
jgi:hypothetical protein